MQQISVDAIDPRILHELRPGEHLLWWGKPNLAFMSQRRTLRAISFRFWLLFCSTLVLLLLGSVELISPLSPTTVTQVNLPALDFFLSIFLLFMLWQAINARIVRARMRAQLKELKQAVYAITNQRIVEVFGNEALRVLSYNKADIGRIDRVETQDGWGDIIFATPEPVVYLPISLTTSRMVGISDLRAVQELLLKTFKGME